MSAAIAPGHIGLSVTDLDRSLAFYREMLDLEVIQSSADGIRLEVYSAAGAAGLAEPVPGAPSCGFF